MPVRIHPGFRVAIRRQALPTLGRDTWRGTVESITDGWLATVRWDHGETTNINVDNLAGLKSVAFVE